MDIRTLVDTVKAKGVEFRIDGDRIKVEARAEPDSETKALLESLRRYKDELRRFLTAPVCWNCGATTARTQDLYGKQLWVCWECAKSA
ncbi:MAG: hypothetical protein EXR70_16685 [Deltaproteobacteria bacterium]|nr:hypothetical protein [Deltaproteobacteria bacterium]